MKNPLSSRENQVAELVAWGSSQKEIADHLGVSIKTVDNHIQRVKKKIGRNKVTEIAAWWFCTNYGISYDLSPMVRRKVATVLLFIFCLIDVPVVHHSRYTQRYRTTRTEYLACRRNTATHRTL